MAFEGIRVALMCPLLHQGFSEFYLFYVFLVIVPQESNIMKRKINSSIPFRAFALNLNRICEIEYVQELLYRLEIIIFSCNTELEPIGVTGQ